MKLNQMPEQLEIRVAELERRIRDLQETQVRQLEQLSKTTQTIYQELAASQAIAPILLVRMLKWELGVCLRKKSKS
jgi:hypothetical protein